MSAWFTKLGQPLTEPERTLLRGYLSGLGLQPELSIETITDFPSASRIIADPNWDRQWWEAEQRERERLRSELSSSDSRGQLIRALSRTVDDMLAMEQDTVAAAFAAFGCMDPALGRAAAGALAEALYLSRLAELARRAPAHAFSAKLGLFAAGHWPLVLLSGRFYIF